MLSWRKKKSPPAETPPPPPPSGGSDLDSALDTLAALLRTLGQGAFDLEEVNADAVAELCEKWAQHVLICAPRPNQPDSKEKKDDAETGRRDWVGIRQFVTQQRRSENVYVSKVLSDLRQVIWAVLTNLNRSLSDHSELEAEVQDLLDRLRAAAENRSTEEIRKTTVEALSNINLVLAERKERQKAQVIELDARIKSLGRELEDSRADTSVDALTRVYNRHAFEGHLTHTVDLHGLFGHSSCLVLVDIDHFKQLNELYGRSAGDHALRQLADKLSRNFLRRNDLVSRSGDNEFSIVLRETDLADARKLCDRLQRSVAELTLVHEDRELQITIAIGVSQIRADETATDWLERTDRALAEAKRREQDRMVVAE